MWILHSPAALRQIIPLRAQAITAAGSTTELELSMGKHIKLCTRAPAAENFLSQPMKGCLVKYKKGMADCACATDLPASTRQAASAQSLRSRADICGEMKEEAVVVPISPLTLFVICLRALICFTDVARAPPSTVLMTECLVTAVRLRACVRSGTASISTEQKLRKCRILR